MNSLSRSQVSTLVENAIAGFPHEACTTCECYLGYLAQLESASGQDGRLFLEGHKPDRNEVHTCLGCDPCPPGDHYAAYLRDRAKT